MTDHMTAKLQNGSRQDEAFDRPDKTRRELALTYAAITLTLMASVGSAGGIAVSLSYAAAAGHWAVALRQVTFLTIVGFLIYGGLVYQFARAGYLKRAERHRAATPRELARFYHDATAAAVSILVPSYKEDPQVVQRTLLSAALQDYPKRRVVLLVDDPPQPIRHEDMRALAATRALPDDIWEILQKPRDHFGDALAAFLDRSARGSLNRRGESLRLAGLYREAADWFEEQAARYAGQGHAERLFVELTFREPARLCLEASSRWESRAHAGRPPAQELREAYQRLADRFTVEVTAFERKRFENLSHEPNKAMNLNSYIGLMGGCWQVGNSAGAPRLESAGSADAELVIPDADYVLMVDADSVLAPEYTLRLAYILSQPGHERLAVAQTPYSAFPGAPGLLERIAGATTDIQYIIHQGFTSCAATFWVGANALVRKAALEDIAEWGQERGHPIRRFIQDRTVIEDTESSVDLIDRGWRLLNYPERLAFSATPPDFGSLLIQRRRWANGGLLILPKLIRYLLRNVRRPGVLGESFMRCHYLASLAVVNTGLLLILAVSSFDDLLHNLWLPLTALPYCGLYARDLRRCGYRANDVLRVYALNLMLIPVHLAGVFQSLRQGWTGTKSSFGRTPKVQERTVTPCRYLVAEYAILAHWLLGTVLEYLHGRPLLAVFALANAAFLAYAMVAFIGLRESWDDLTLAVTATGSGPASARPRPLSPDY
jgi:cellulose synthase/poly-beta-1,6-N-acetylglucosamine synthase-like glycosyltransferase